MIIQRSPFIWHLSFLYNPGLGLGLKKCNASGKLCKDCYQVIHKRKDTNNQQIYENVSNLLESIMDTNQISKAFFFFNSIDNKDVVKGKPSTSPSRSTNTSLTQEEKLNVK